MVSSALFLGLGRIGLPQSLVFAGTGIKVFGYDNDENMIQMLKAGELAFFEPGMKNLFSDTLGKTYFPISAWDNILQEVEAIFFTVGMDITPDKNCLAQEEGDIEHIKILLVKILLNPSCRKGILLVFRTTLFLGGTERLKNHVENTTKLKEGVDFYMCFVPERLAEGAAIHEERTLPKIIGAFNDTGFDLAKNIFERIGGKIIRVSNPRTAEFCKLTDNSYRNTMFAFANELAMWASNNNVDVQEVILANNSEYTRNNIPVPGFVSGYCLAKDPYIFEYGFDKNIPKRDFQSLWFHARRINDFLYNFVASEVIEALKENGIEPARAKVAILGLSFKEDVDDFRMSHAFALIDELNAFGVTQIVGYDPALHSCKYTHVPLPYQKQSNQWVKTLDPQNFAGVNVVILAHRHLILREMSMDTIKSTLSRCALPVIVYDGWNIWRDARNIAEVKYRALGFK